MIKVIIIEDEAPAAQNLSQMLCEISDKIEIEAMPGSVAESVEYLSTHPKLDIIFSDVQLRDGHAFEIFKEVDINTPVIFTTAYDDFMMSAFEHNGIDYLLKPIYKSCLKKALEKYAQLQNHFAAKQPAIRRFVQQYDLHKKNRIVARKGMLHVSLKLEDVVLFFTENKMVFVVDTNRKQYIIEKNLSDIEMMLDPNLFFRANRQYIININYIKCFKSFDKVKLLLDLNVPELQHTIVVSQENCAPFKKWMYEA